MNLKEIYEETYSASNSLQLERYLKSVLDNEARPSEWLLEKVHSERNIKHLQEMVTVESGRIYISEIDETKAITDIRMLKIFYKNYVLQKMNSEPHWKKVQVENTEPILEIEILKRCIDHWYSESNKRKQIIAIQGLPYFIQKMRNIRPEMNNKLRKKSIEYLYRADCPNVVVDNTIHTVKITIIKRYDEDHRIYSWYLNNLFFE